MAKATNNDNESRKALQLVEELTDNPLLIEENADNILDAFEKVDVKHLQQLNTEYLKLDENSSYAFIFTGMTVLKGQEGKEYEGVKLIGKDSKNYVTGLSVLVNELKKVTQLPCLVKIITKKEKKSSSGLGKYMDMEIYTVPMETVKS